MGESVVENNPVQARMLREPLSLGRGGREFDPEALQCHEPTLPPGTDIAVMAFARSFAYLGQIGSAGRRENFSRREFTPSPTTQEYG